jgi:glycosyltransferase involved in cell wall biosynthesis
VLRQIEYLAPHYDLTVIGYGPPNSHLGWLENVTWVSVGTVDEDRTESTLPSGKPWKRRVRDDILPHVPTPMRRRIVDAWERRKPAYGAALRAAIDARADAYHANDWTILDVAAAAARRNGARLVLDAHEYAPLEYEDDPGWLKVVAPSAVGTLERHAGHIDASVTVAPLIAARYRTEFGLDPIVVLNAPKPRKARHRPVDPSNIRLIHHGGARSGRKLERMIEAVGLAQERFTLSLMLVGGSQEYRDRLQHIARVRAPGRVSFLTPVAPGEIVERISEFDMGFYLLEPTSFNNAAALPNKLFDFLAAGLAVCIGPSPGMEGLIQEYGCGAVSASFEPSEVAHTLDSITGEDLERMQRAAARAAEVLNADNEMTKLLELYARLLRRESD